jgi:hypothetical protein
MGGGYPIMLIAIKLKVSKQIPTRITRKSVSQAHRFIVPHLLRKSLAKNESVDRIAKKPPASKALKCLEKRC